MDGTSNPLHYNNTLDSLFTGPIQQPSVILPPVEPLEPSYTPSVTRFESLREAESDLERMAAERDLLLTRERVLGLELQLAATKRPRVKSRKELSFDGKKLLEPFLLEFRSEATNQGIWGDDAAMGQLLVSSLTGEALTWASSFAELPSGYRDLLELIQKTYRRTGAIRDAQDKLRNLKQLGDGALFNGRFNTLVQQSGYDLHSRHAKELYLDALSHQVRSAHMGRLGVNETLAELQAWAEESISEISRMNAASGVRTTHWIHPTKSDKGNISERASVQVVTDERTCFGCGKKGHVRKDCTSASGDNSTRNGTQGRSGTPYESKCWACGRPGHRQSSCPRFLEWKKREREELEKESNKRVDKTADF